jgi:nitroreductase
MLNIENASALDQLLSRYSMGGKHLVEPGPSAEQLQVVAAAALRAPDHAELMPFRLCVVQGEAKQRMADLFERYARKKGKDTQSCAIERERAIRAPVTIAIIARIDAHHPIVPAHEQWMSVGGAITNLLNAVHMMGFSGKMLSGEKVRAPEIIAAFCDPGETLVGWVSIGTPTKTGSAKSRKETDAVLSFF